MDRAEVALREILAKTQHELRKHDENFRFKVEHDKPRKRYVCQVLMGRKEFEENYLLRENYLRDYTWSKMMHDTFVRSILKNLELNERFNNN